MLITTSNPNKGAPKSIINEFLHEFCSRIHYKESQHRPIMEESTEATFARKEAEEKDTIPSVDEAVAYLQIRVFGMHMNDPYRSHCAAILREYLAERKRVGVMDEWAIVKDALQKHYATIDKVVKWDMQAVKRYNDSINFVQRKTVRLGNWTVTIPFTTMELNKLKHTENRSTLSSIFIAILKLIILGLFADCSPTIWPIILFVFLIR